MAHRVCPWWMGYVLLNPLRKLIQNPQKILFPYIRPGMTVLDVGCGMGYFSLDMAALAGPSGRVVCVDLQEKMIRSLKKRAQKAGLNDRIDSVICGENGLGLEAYKEKIDFAIAFYIVHEVPDTRRFVEQIHSAIKPGGRFLVAEPGGHISEGEYRKSVQLVTECGFKETENPRIFRSYVSIFEKI